MIILNEIKSKDRKRFGKTYPGHVLKGHKAEIIPGASIRIHGEEWNHINAPVAFDRTFKVGDEAEYGSYNLKYTGEIVKIGAKTVTIRAYDRNNHQITIETFSWRNWDFDGEKIAKYNAEEMVCL
ncbi:MAG: hypothetical protein KKB31_04640 [Nanoarchaeota archaeon]|nr:hypothetical protein [Nanoarchaeota archaeon]